MSNILTASVKPDCWLACSSCFWRGIPAPGMYPAWGKEIFSSKQPFMTNTELTFWMLIAIWSLQQWKRSGNTRTVTREELTWLRGEVTVYRVTRLLVGEVLHGLKRRRSCVKRKASVVVKKNCFYNHNIPHSWCPHHWTALIVALQPLTDICALPLIWELLAKLTGTDGPGA